MKQRQLTQRIVKRSLGAVGEPVLVEVPVAKADSPGVALLLRRPPTARRLPSSTSMGIRPARAAGSATRPSPSCFMPAPAIRQVPESWRSVAAWVPRRSSSRNTARGPSSPRSTSPRIPGPGPRTGSGDGPRRGDPPACGRLRPPFPGGLLRSCVHLLRPGAPARSGGSAASPEACAPAGWLDDGDRGGSWLRLLSSGQPERPPSDPVHGRAPAACGWRPPDRAAALPIAGRGRLIARSRWLLGSSTRTPAGRHW